MLEFEDGVLVASNLKARRSGEAVDHDSYAHDNDPEMAIAMFADIAGRIATEQAMTPSGTH